MKNDNLMAEDKFDLKFFYVLDKIKSNYLMLVDKEKPIIYSIVVYPYNNNPIIPNSSEEQTIVMKLEKLNAIRQVEDVTDFQISENGENRPKSVGIHLYIKLNNTVFDEVYSSYKKKIKNLKTPLEQKNILILNKKNGETKFISSSGGVYETRFSPKTNSYQLLLFLAQNPDQHFGFDELSKHLNTPKKGAKTPIKERRVRDTIQNIKDKLQCRGEELFETDYGFTLKTRTQINT